MIQDIENTVEEVCSDGGSQEIRSCESVRSVLEAHEAESGAGISLRVISFLLNVSMSTVSPGESNFSMRSCRFSEHRD
jgi:hypothetical protein